MTAHPVIGWPDWTQATPLYTPSVSGGSFSASLPVANVLDRRLSKLARTTDALAASTTFDIDLGVARTIGVLAVLIPNLTKSAVPTIRWKAANVNNFSGLTYDSTALTAWPTGLTAEDVVGQNVWLSVLTGTFTDSRYVRLAIVDTANTDGHLDFARVIVASAYTPTYNFSVGAKSQLVTDSQRLPNDFGGALYLDKPRARTDVFSIANLPTSEAYLTVRKMQRQLGITGQFFWMLDNTATGATLAEQSYAATFKEIGALDFPNVLPANTIAFSVIEDL